MAVLGFSTLAASLLTQGNAIFSLLRMLGSSFFIALTLIVLVQSAAVAHANLASIVTASSQGIFQPWIDLFGSVGTGTFQLFASAEINKQATMIGYLNAFHLLTLAPALLAPLSLFFYVQKHKTA